MIVHKWAKKLDRLQLQLLDKDEKKVILQPFKYDKFIAVLNNRLINIERLFIAVDTLQAKLIQTLEKFESNLKKGHNINYRRKKMRRKTNWKLGYTLLERHPRY